MHSFCCRIRFPVYRLMKHPGYRVSVHRNFVQVYLVCLLFLFFLYPSFFDAASYLLFMYKPPINMPFTYFNSQTIEKFSLQKTTSTRIRLPGVFLSGLLFVKLLLAFNVIDQCISILLSLFSSKLSMYLYVIS